MKTYDLARALNTLARALREEENAELATVAIQPKRGAETPSSVATNAPTALMVLLHLSNYSKAEWRSLIEDLELDVPVKSTDSIRDILGRVLKYLNENKDSYDRIVEKAQTPQKGTSPELMKALSILLNK